MRLRVLWFVVPVLVVAVVVAAVVLTSGGGGEVAEVEPAAEVEAEVEAGEEAVEEERPEVAEEPAEVVEEPAEVAEEPAEVAEEPAGVAETEEAEVTPEPAAEEPSPCENGIVVENLQENPGLVRDCEALLASRDALAGEGSLNWDAGQPITEWDGVRLSGEPRRVSGLDLEGSGLRGHIPAELGRLFGLRELRLNDNQLTGPIPTSLGSLQALRSLWLQSNALSGPIPPELGALSALGHLALSHNRLTGPIPAALEALARLERLHLAHNSGLTGCVPLPLRHVAENDVVDLDLPDCPPPACNNGVVVPNPADNPGLVADCVILLTVENTLTGVSSIPWSLASPISHWKGVTVDGAPPRVRRLDLSRRVFRGRILPQLGGLTALETLDLGHNALTGSIPAELGRLSGLRELRLQDNQLTGPIPAELGILAHLERLHLGENPGLTGCVPWPLKHIPENDSATLDLPNCPPPPCANGVTIPSPADNPRLVRDCTVLLLAGPLLAGDANLNWGAETVITAWEGITIGGDPAGVRGLALPSSGLTGHIPWQLGSLPELRVLRLHDNQLSGAIPAQLATLAGLQRLELHDNQLDGELPQALGSLGALQSLDLSGNRLTGRIPAELGYLGALQSLRLSDNRLTGTIPVGLGYLVGIEELSLGGNAGLTGCIPSRLWDAAETDLASLSLSDCPPPSPSPPLPTLELELELCENGIAVEDPEGNPRLVQACAALLAAKDALAGEGRLNWDAGTPIREWDGFSIVSVGRPVISLDLESHGLTGHIPPVLGSVPDLFYLRLSGNRLTGPIPPELGLLHSLRALWLSGNQLTGPIPPELGLLRGLGSLWLNHNELMGQIPAALGSLTNLGELVLSDNLLTGPIPPALLSIRHLSSVSLGGNPGLTGCQPSAHYVWHDYDPETDPAVCTGEPRTELCENGAAVPDPGDNPDLVADCAVLLTIRDPLAGAAVLDWDADRPITTWEGITIGGDPPRVIALALPSRGLRGHLPPGLSRLRGLRELRLEDNRLISPIPFGLRALDSLESLELHSNKLIGPNPGRPRGPAPPGIPHSARQPTARPDPSDADIREYPGTPVAGE